MRGLCSITLIGNLGADPVIRATKTENGKAANFTVAVNRTVPDAAGGRPRERTDWFRVSCFNGLAALAEESLRKGDRVAIQGVVEVGEYMRDGTKIPTFQVIARELVFLSPKTDAAREANPAGPENEVEAGEPALV